MFRLRLLLAAPVLVLLVLLVLGGAAWWTSRDSMAGWIATRVGDSNRTEVRDRSGIMLAELTDGARTVPMMGPWRTWTEPGTDAQVTEDRWVRLLPEPYDGSFDTSEASWLRSALADTSPDVLAVAFQYITGAHDQVRDGVTMAGDASYGPRLGADFNDYLGVEWTYGTEVDPPEPEEIGSLDCSGFVRIVLGYRLGMPMSLDPATDTLPRIADDQLNSGPGQLIVENKGSQVTSFDMLRPGDLVFFDASNRDGRA
ncbi:MAG: hypothetical protein ABIO99_08275, partial [Candidatus Limnocylindria bacterium]